MGWMFWVEMGMIAIAIGVAGFFLWRKPRKKPAMKFAEVFSPGHGWLHFETDHELTLDEKALIARVGWQEYDEFGEGEPGGYPWMPKGTRFLRLSDKPLKDWLAAAKAKKAKFWPWG